MADFTHVRAEGGVHMVDVSGKADTLRTAVAVGKVVLGPEAFERVRDNTVRKGDVLSIAQIAGIMGAKETPRLIPLCHQVQIQGVDVDLSLDDDVHAVTIRAFAKSLGPTGVEMEALTAVSVAALTVYDMCKAVDKGMRIVNIRLTHKAGGKSGTFEAE